MLKAGLPAPVFDLPDADMSMVSLANYKGSNNVVLYFYPKDGTPGCTMEAIEFSELQDDFEKHDAVVLGVSMDDCLSHGTFRDKHGLSVQLLADTEGEVCERYGVMHDKEVEGNIKKRCILRSTFVIDKQGIIRHALYGVSPRHHAKEVLNLMEELS